MNTFLALVGFVVIMASVIRITAPILARELYPNQASEQEAAPASE